MVSVYLPMGYPTMQGQEFTNVIYQGTVVRLYVVPADPRTDSQVFNRRFLSDVSKVRSTMGLWGKAACKLAMGSKWGTVLHQAMRADLDSCYSNAIAEWDDMSSTDQDGWREFAPFQATFNDPGKMWFAFNRVIYYALGAFADYAWLSYLWDANQYEDAAAWWSDSSPSQVFAGLHQDQDLNPVKVGTWSTVPGLGSGGGSILRCANAANQIITIAFYGRRCAIGHQVNSVGGNGEAWFDGVLDEILGMYGVGDPQFFAWTMRSRRKDLHVFKLVRLTNQVNLDYFYVYDTYS